MTIAQLLIVASAQAAVAAKEATQVFASPDHVGSQLGTGVVVSYLLYILKKAGWFVWLTDDTSSKIQAAWGGIAAVFTAAGVHLATTGTFLDGAGFTITLTGLSANVLRDIVWQWTAQQGWYDLVLRQRDTATETIEVLKKVLVATQPPPRTEGTV